MKDANKLLDLLSAAGESAIEPTPAAAAGRGPLYPEVNVAFPIPSVYSFLLTLID